MAILKKQETSDGRGSVLVAEFTTGQAVLLLCAGLVLLGAAFVTGRLVAHVDRPIDLAAQSASLQGADPGAQQSATPPSPASPATPEPSAKVETGPTQTYTVPAMEAGASTPAAVPAAAAPAAPMAATTAAQSSNTAASTVPASSPPQATAPETPSTLPPSTPAETASATPSVPAAPAPAAPPAQPTQVIPVQSVLPPPPPSKTAPLVASAKPRLTDLPPLPSNAATQAAPAPVHIEKPAEPVVAPAQTTAASSAAAPTQIVPADPAVTEAAAAAAPPVVEAAPATPPAPQPAAAPPITTAVPPAEKPKTPPATGKTADTAKTSTFAVQLGSFTGAQRQAKAQSLQKRVKRDYGLNAQVIDSAKEDMSRVVIPGYADKNSASAACAELRKKSGLNSAFVRAL